jgi:PAS domain-containing protein
LEEGANQGVAFVLDISERKRAERALRDSEELKRRIIESSSGLYQGAGLGRKLAIHEQRRSTVARNRQY